MDEKLNLIYARRSVRKYESSPVPEQTVKELLEAAMAAPSAVAKDPWHFIIIRNPERLTTIAEVLPYGKMLGEAPLGIVVCGDINAAHDQQISYLLQDCSAAIQNLLLAATGLGLGACWLGVHPRQDRIDHVTRHLDLPEHIVPVSAIALGYPAEDKSPRTRYRDDAVHEESW